MPESHPRPSRSRSPTSTHRAKRTRSHSPHRHRHHHSRVHHHHSHHPDPVTLPLNATPLSRHAFTSYKPLLASYLSLQKQLDLSVLGDSEAKGRWQSFVRKWNAGLLAEGWYDGATRLAAEESAREADVARAETDAETARPHVELRREEDDSDADSYGPALPTSGKLGRGATFAELALRESERGEDAAARHADLAYARKSERRSQREALDELVPRAEGGTRERQLEKKREAAGSARSFAEGKGAGDGLAEVADSTMFGSTGTDEVQAMKAASARKKNERELRREEVLAARAAEREERVRGAREREGKTMDMLKAIAKERFG